ncbi:MAG: BadF/BadG/BcrA/BcrD ATPase family protein [Caldilineaceae bacterium]
MTSPIVLGIDGGGTKTVAVVMNREQQVLGRAQAGSTNWNSVGVETARNNLWAVSEQALRKAGRSLADVAAICIGASGVDRPDDRARMQTWLAELAPQAATAIHNDAVVALSAGTGGDVYGLVLISGTGMIVYGFDHSRQSRRAGGTGALLGDPGSGYAIGADSLAAVMWAADGRGPETSLTGAILGQLGMKNPTELIPWTYADTAWERFASVAPQAIGCAQTGDPVALAILEKAASGLAVAVQAVAVGLAMGDDFPLVMAGGLLRPGFYAGLVEQAVRAFALSVKIIHPQAEPAIGAGLLALKEI